MNRYGVLTKRSDKNRQIGDNRDTLHAQIGKEIKEAPCFDRCSLILVCSL